MGAGQRLAGNNTCHPKPIKHHTFMFLRNREITSHFHANCRLAEFHQNTSISTLILALHSFVCRLLHIELILAILTIPVTLA